MAALAEIADLPARVLAGDTRALARAATLLESQTAQGRELLAALYPHTGHAMIVGITGPPGAGKSTLVDRLTKLLRTERQSVAIVAIDPSSPYSRGAILGDRIRMQDHHADSGVFIRSMASRGKLGGLASATLDLALLFDAAGRDVVLIETIGVGQDEVDIARLADVTVLVLVPGAGDDVQAIKAGIMEIADVFAINKSDLPGAERLEQEIRAMQSFGSEAGRANAAPLCHVVANRGSGVEELLTTIRAAHARLGRRNLRTETWSTRLSEMLRDSLLTTVPADALEKHAKLVAAKIEDPYAALTALLAQAVSPPSQDGH